MDWLTTAQFAELLGVSMRRAQTILASGAVEHRRIGRQYVIPRAIAEAYAARDRRPGRWFAAEPVPDYRDPAALVLDELVSAIDDSDRVLATLSDAAPYDHKEHAVRHALMKARARLEARS